MQHPKLRSVISALVAAFLLSGCKPDLYLETPPAIAVEPTTHVLLLKVPPGGYLARVEANRLVDFLRVASGGRPDAIHITVVGLRREARHAVLKTVKWVGIAPRNVKQVEGIADGQHHFAVRVIAVRYHAHPPVCPSLNITGPSANDNDFEPTLGCSSLANLAAMANDPKDLIENTTVPPVDGERAALPVARYRTFGADPAAHARPGNTTSVNQTAAPAAPNDTSSRAAK